MAEMIRLRELTKKFGSLTAVDGISLSVGGGEVLGFLGPNGAGKSTTMKMVSGFLAPTSGSANVCGYDVAEEPVKVKSRIGYLPERGPSYGDMTPRSFLDFIAAIRGFDGNEKTRRVAQTVERLALGEVLGQTIDTLSKGFKSRVGLAQAILHDPEVLMLDEPTDGLDPNQKHHVRNLILEMAKDKAIIVSTHILEEVEAVCTRVVIIARGRLLTDGTPEELLARSRHHNSVLVTMDASAAEPVRKEIAALNGVEGVDILDGLEDRARLRVLAKQGRPIAIEISGLIRAKNLPVRELQVEKGSLDEVFRDITRASEGMGEGDA
ncbi:MAG: ATP-binding cassette domain-containing protein [Rhodospirillales bacterium]|jgi:ABC-2 type transport system ATP-binding protein|nr:ATP-binding cassette domain-containing protein [Rhodospirillales bacterium]MDP7098326.1 ATP-binding cassette domain-containing protein [Rhodospirillales bacterium]MDP7215220.1 ATP-binding cassette domain-containing protein [Rhodospirillales bacterium]HJP53425.1 ATP-binding cassette domain-containing protein [Rhodospirillales bacterium]